MHYQHQFHAGNFADVFKHVALCGLFAALNRKDAPWFFLDTHAGAGRYDLNSAAAGKTGEWREGIARLAQLKEAPEPLATLLRLAQGRHYPGSPLIAKALARPQDRVVLCEKVPMIAAQLKTNCASAELHERDGYEAASLLPPKEKRGLILVDPPFERPDEFDAAAQFLKSAQARFAHGIYAVWYALKNRRGADQFLRKAAALNRPWRAFEFDNGAKAEGQMHACGLLVLNPPFQFDADIRPAMELLVERLAQGPNASYEAKSATPVGLKSA